MNTKNKKPFREKVFRIVSEIPAGGTLSYKKVAELAGSPRACRSVGSILNKNYDSQIPCHRVICSDGKIGGYNRGAKSKIKKLRKEGIRIINKNGIYYRNKRSL
jgi:O-6-methylguanine DNA methyltransferase